jgi:hypothetical protein
MRCSFLRKTFYPGIDSCLERPCFVEKVHCTNCFLLRIRVPSYVHAHFSTGGAKYKEMGKSTSERRTVATVFLSSTAVETA